jgi:hypothetical protein
MNNHKRVLWFVVIITSSLFLLSLLSAFFSIENEALKNISIVSDIFHQPKQSIEAVKQTIDTLVIVESKNTLDSSSVKKKFKLYQTPNRITNYAIDSSAIALPKFIQKLEELQKGKRKKIRIAFLGDSMIEDDLITQTFRTFMQQRFGGYGVGFLPISYPVANGRTTATISASGNWREINFRNNTDKTALFISGRSFFATGHSVTEIVDKTAKNNIPLQKYLLYGKTAAADVVANGKQIKIAATVNFSSILLDSSSSNKIKLDVNNQMPVFGISLESPHGIIVDNFSFRGNSGTDFAKMDSTFLQSIAANHSYDLLVLQYGVNIFEKATDENFDWYSNPMKKSIQKLKACFSNADILLMSTADRSFRYGTEYKTAKGMNALLYLQQKIAFESGISFYNTFMSIGGEGSMVNWVNSKPPLAYKDFMHPNSLGSAIIGRSLFQSVLNEYQKIINTTENHKR